MPLVYEAQIRINFAYILLRISIVLLIYQQIKITSAAAAENCFMCVGVGWSDCGLWVEGVGEGREVA